jgi:hypothetical protein
MNPSNEYIGYDVNDTVWVLIEYVTNIQVIAPDGTRKCCWEKHSWSTNPSGPWTEFRWIPMGFV